MKKLLFTLLLCFNFTGLTAAPIDEFSALFHDGTKQRILKDWQQHKKIHITPTDYLAAKPMPDQLKKAVDAKLGGKTLDQPFYEKFTAIAPEVEILIFDRNAPLPDVSKCVRLKRFQSLRNNSETVDLSGLNGLESLELKGCAPPHFKGLSALKTLALEGGHFKEAPDFSGCTSLETLTFKNMFSYEVRFDLSPCTALKHVIFEVRGLQTTPHFKGLSALKTLTIKGGRFKEATDFSGCISLEELFIEGTSLENQLDLSPCTALKRVACVNNDFQTAPCFKGLSALKTLALEGGSFEVAPDFSGCTSLEELTITYMLCLEAQLDLSNCRALKTLDLQWNRLKFFPKLSAEAPLETLNFEENCLTEVPSLVSWGTLKTVNLSSNRLLTMPQIPEGCKILGAAKQFFDIHVFANLFREEWRQKIIDGWDDNWDGTLNLRNYGPLPKLFWHALSLRFKKWYGKDDGYGDDKYLAINLIKTLDLSGCNLTMVPAVLWTNAGFLRSLNIQNNPNILYFAQVPNETAQALASNCHNAKIYLDQSHLGLPGAGFLAHVSFKNMVTEPPLFPNATESDFDPKTLGRCFDIHVFANLFREEWRQKIITDWENKTLDLSGYGTLPPLFWDALQISLYDDCYDNYPAIVMIKNLNLSGCNLTIIPPVLMDNIFQFNVLNIQNNPGLLRFAEIQSQEMKEQLDYTGKNELYIDEAHLKLPGAEFLIKPFIQYLEIKSPLFEEQ